MHRPATWGALALLVLALSARAARAFEAESDLTVSRDFVYLTTDLQGELLDGWLGLGGGFVVVSNFHGARYGLRTLAELSSERFSGGLVLAYSPLQDQRGWASLEPRLATHLVFGRLALDAEVRLTLRRANVASRRGSVAIDQLQLDGEGTLTLDERWHLTMEAIRSFYDRDLAGRALRGADLGPAVTLAGRPEVWALGARAGRRLGAHLRLEAGLTGVDYADGPGGALMPRAAIRAGPWGGFSIEAKLEIVIAIAGARDPVREIGGLALSFER
jgi:hypothetical protein